VSWLQNKIDSMPSAYTGAGGLRPSDNGSQFPKKIDPPTSDPQKTDSLVHQGRRPSAATVATATVTPPKRAPVTAKAAPQERVEALFQPLTKEIHFIHIPKCGGTTMTTLLRQIQCDVDPTINADCCLNPGFCDWHAKRRCSTIKGCINHFPQR
jgi:hypothetical protein